MGASIELYHPCLQLVAITQSHAHNKFLRKLVNAAGFLGNHEPAEQMARVS